MPYKPLEAFNLLSDDTLLAIVYTCDIDMGETVELKVKTLWHLGQ